MNSKKVSRFILPVILVGALLTMAWGVLAAIPGPGDAVPDGVTAAPFLHDFESGIPAGLVGFADSWDGSGSSTTLALAVIAQESPQVPETVDNDVLTVTYDVAASGSWGGGPGYAGITYDASATQDWSGYSAFSFWWYGGNTGGEHRIELKTAGASPAESNRFVYSFMDDFSGWKYFALPFADFVKRTDFNPGAALGDSIVLEEMWGYSVLLSAGVAGTFNLDNVSVTGYNLQVDFESGIPVGFVGFADSWDGSGSTTTLSYELIDTPLPFIPEIIDNTVLSVTYNVAASGSWGGGPGYAGLTHDFSTTQDWTSFEGFSFWWYGGNTGAEHRIELKTDGASPTESNRFVYAFLDDFSGWKYFTLPFTDFAKRTDFNPGAALGDTPALDLVWGYSVLLSAGVQGTFYFDQTAAYGGVEALSVAFADDLYSVTEGGTATITVILNMVSTETVTVSYATSDGTADSGDYTAASGTLTFDPGVTEQSFSVVTLDDTSDEAAETVNLTLSDPVNAELGARDTAVLSIADNDQPNLCTLFTVPVDDFESGLPSGTDGDGLDIGFVTWGDFWNGTTVAISDPSVEDTDPLALPGQAGPNHLLQLDADVVGWGGVTHAFENEALDTWITQDWSSYEGVSFWVYGHNTGATLFFEVQDNRNPGSTTSDTEIWSYAFPDDFSGWQYVEIPFSAFTRKEIGNGAPNDGFGRTEVHGWAFGMLTNPGPITYYLDDVGLIVRTTVVDDFESGLPYGVDGDGLEIGFVTWGDTWNGTSVEIDDPLIEDTNPLALPCQNGPTHLLQVDANVVGWGGVTHAFENEAVDTWITQDWSDYEGISFWAYGHNTGATLLFEIQDNRNPGSTTSDTEVFSYAFPDDFSGWQHFTLPFSAFTRKEIGNGAPDDGFGRTEVHAWAFGMLTNPGPLSYYVEDVTIWGRTPVVQPLQVSFDQVDYHVDEGGLAEILVTLNMEATEPVTVTFTTEQADSLNKALIDRDFTPTSGELVFEPGITEQTFTVQTLQDIKYEGEELLRLRLSDPQNAELGYVYRARLYITSDDPYNPLLLDDFEIFPYPFKTQGGLILSTPEIAAADAMALPGQGPFEHILEVAHGGPGPDALLPTLQSFSDTFPMAQDWSMHNSYVFWYYGTNSGDEITVELQDNRLPDPGPSGWTLVWSDEFDGLADSSPAAGRWTHEIGNGFDQANNGWGNGELEYYTADTENSAMDGSGSLVITAQEIDPATTELECWYGPCEYTSARLISSQKFEMAYGRVEARLKLPYGQGLWPAFWMLGNDIGEVGWPTCGEIDIMEHIGSIPDTSYGTIHGPGYSGGAGIGGSYTLNSGGFSDEYHVFAIEWEPGVIRWYVDGELFLTLTDADIPAGTEWVFDHPFFLIMNVAVGGTWPGYPDETTVFPQTMMVDYVRVYQAADTAERFGASFVDDFTGWQFIRIPLADFTRSADQPVGAPDDGLTLTEVWGHGFILDAMVGEEFYFDQLQLMDLYYKLLPLVYKLGTLGG
jgi:beta-glucanase (GH16 family)